MRQGLIDALVDLDLEYEREREVLRRSSLVATLKTRLLTKLKDQYRIRRQPYMQQLAALQECPEIGLELDHLRKEGSRDDATRLP